MAVLASCGNANVTGRVTADGKPLAGVLVSDGVQIVKTNARGHYSMKSGKADSVVFITTPSGYVAESRDGLQPGFWARLDKPVNEKEVNDFNLRSEDQTHYSMLFLTDAHLINDPKRNDLNRFKNQIMPLIRSEAEKRSQVGAVYSANLGDLSQDFYWKQFEFNEEDAYNFMKGCGYPAPLYSVTGNHDNDPTVVGDSVDFRAAWLYRRCFGPDRFSVNIGGDHWIFMDDVIYINTEGKGKKAPGVRGARDYTGGFTDAQMAWLEKDLSYVSDTAGVYLCVHIPLIYSGKKDGLLFTKEQMREVDSLFSKFPHVSVFSGHVHKYNHQVHPDFPRFTQYCIVATSGNIWECPETLQLLGQDGADAGIMIASAGAGEEMTLDYQTVHYGQKVMRVYDMNGVREYCRHDRDMRALLKMHPDKDDYSRKEFADKVMVNWWAYEPGLELQMFEDGKPLEVKAVDLEDPLYFICYDIPYMKKKGFKKGNGKQTAFHTFMAAAATSDSPVTVRVVNAAGEVLHEETLERPKQFGPAAE